MLRKRRRSDVELGLARVNLLPNGILRGFYVYFAHNETYKYDRSVSDHSCFRKEYLKPGGEGERSDRARARARARELFMEILYERHRITNATRAANRRERESLLPPGSNVSASNVSACIATNESVRSGERQRKR